MPKTAQEKAWDELSEKLGADKPTTRAEREAVRKAREQLSEQLGTDKE